MGVTKDEKEAVCYYKLAADQGNSFALSRLGDCYENGIGVDKDEEDAIHYYKLAADQGYTNAQYALRRMRITK